MKTIFSYSSVVFCVITIFLAGAFSGCIQHTNSDDNKPIEAKTDTITVDYASGFDINYLTNSIQVITQSFGENEDFKDTFQINSSYDSILSRTIYSNLPSRFVCQSTTHLAYMQVLGSLNQIHGVCGLNYLVDTLLKKDLSHAIEICAEEKINYEILKAINPDLFLIYPFETEGKKIYSKDGIKTLYIAEYLETNVIARLEWIKLFGILTNKVKEANAYFKSVLDEYNAVKSENPVNKNYILNLPFKDAWHMPSSNSLVVNLLNDAGLTYYYQNDAATENVLRPTEQIWNDGINADYWIIMAGRNADFDLNELIQEEPIYAQFKSVKNNQVIFCNTNTTDYFGKAVVEPHVMLKDILFATKQIDNHTPVYFKLLQ